MIRMGSLSVHFEIINTAGLSHRWQDGEQQVLHAVTTCNRQEKFPRLQTNRRRSCSARGPSTSKFSGLLPIARSYEFRWQGIRMTQ